MPLASGFDTTLSKQHKTDAVWFGLITDSVKRHTHHRNSKGFMHNQQAFQPGTKEPSRSLASQTSITEQQWHLDDALKASQPTLASSTLMILPLGLIAVWAIAIASVRQRQKQRSDNGLRQDDRHRRHDQVPCRNCVFFTNSSYLKCTVNPVDALTQTAIDCTDYAPNVPSPQEKRNGRQA